MDILGHEFKDQARPWTNCRYWQGTACDYGSEGWEFNSRRALPILNAIVSRPPPPVWMNLPLRCDVYRIVSRKLENLLPCNNPIEREIRFKCASAVLGIAFHTPLHASWIPRGLFTR
jgi:hypothetical protein